MKNKIEKNKGNGVVWLDVNDDFAGQRLDNYLMRFLKGVPKSFIYRVIRSGEVRVNSRRVLVHYRLKLNDRLRLPPMRTSGRESQQEKMIDSRKQFDESMFSTPNKAHRTQSKNFIDAGFKLFPILYEDDFLLAIDKPAGVAVHGGSGISFGIIERLRRFILDKDIKCSFLELVHRLDKETSGVLLLAKKRSVLVDLHKQIRDRTVLKKYFACVSGDCFDNKKYLNVTAPLRKYFLPSGERRVLVDWENGQSAQTIFFLKRKVGNFLFLEAELRTGRTHQIRVHLASLGTPIVGDDKYGDFQLNKELSHISKFVSLSESNLSVPHRALINRMFLHAHFFNFFHPIDKRIVTLSSPLPSECVSFLRRVG